MARNNASEITEDRPHQHLISEAQNTTNIYLMNQRAEDAANISEKDIWGSRKRRSDWLTVYRRKKYQNNGSASRILSIFDNTGGDLGEPTVDRNT